MRSLPLFLSLAFVACGGDNLVKPIPDAAPRPDTPDAPTAGLVKLTITVGTTPQANVTVYFQNADSSLVSATTTDASGVASATMEPGGFVTAIDAFPAQLGIAARALTTFSGVKPGDELVLAQPDNVNGTSLTILASLDPSQTAVSYEVHTPCSGSTDITNGIGSGGTTVTLFGCGATTDFTVVGRDQGSHPIKAFFKPNVAISDGATIDLTGETYVDTESASFDFTNLPDSVASLQAGGFQLGPHGVAFDTFNSAAVTSNAASITGVQRPVIANATQVTLSRFFGSANGLPSVVDWGPASTSYAFSATDVFLNEYQSAPTWDFTSNGVTWTADSAGQQPDFVRVFGQFQRTDAQQNVTFWQWELVAPGDTTSAVFPQLPAPDDVFTPLATDDTQDILSLTTAKVPGGYDAVRAVVLSSFDSFFGLPTGLILGPSGRLVFEELALRAVRGNRKMWSPFAAPSVHRK